MKSLAVHLNENLNDDIKSADSIIDDIRKFMTKVIKVRKLDEANDYDQYFEDLITLCSSAIENIEFSIAGAITESVDEKISLNIDGLMQHAEVILDNIKSLAKSTKVLSIEIKDAKVDLSDIIDRLSEFKNEL